MTPPALVLDSHIDIPWPNPADPFTHTTRQVDFPKMRAGHLTAACFVAYVPQTPLTAEAWAEAQSRARAMLHTIAAMAQPSAAIPTRLTPRAADVAQAVADGAIALIPVIENGHALGNSLASIPEFAALGARYLTLTHNGHNALADSAIPRPELSDPPARHGGLSDLGRAAIAELNRNHILIDVSHTSKATMMQAADLSETPIIASHSCVRALCDHPRNLDDEQLDRLAAAGGVIQITAMSWFLKKAAKPDQVGLDAMIDHIDYAIRRIGLAHVGISSDFDGGGGISDWSNAAETANVTHALRARGYTEAEINALWGGNFLRVLAAAE